MAGIITYHMVSCATLSAKIVSKGLDNMDFSMLPPQLRFEILSSVGELFFKKGNIRDSVRSFAIACNMDRLVEIGDWLLTQNRFEEAAQFFIPTGTRKILEDIGFKCAEAENYALALRCFEAAGSAELVEFMHANFLNDSKSGEGRCI